jgi:hypothetical protein
MEILGISKDKVLPETFNSNTNRITLPDINNLRISDGDFVRLPWTPKEGVDLKS